MQLEGKTAVVLGAAAAGNMGQVIARRFATEGARVMVAGRHEGSLRDLADEIGGDFLCCDITSGEDVERLAKTVVSRFGKLDIGVNAVGVGAQRPFLDVSRDELEAMLAVQFIGPFQYFQSLLRCMSNGGSIIQISSAVATIMLEDVAAYQGTKAGIDHVVRAIANQFGARGIRANSISPGFTDTPMTTGALGTPGIRATFEKEVPLGRLNTSEDVAYAAVWLASDRCFMTGENLQVNGGLRLRRNPRGEEIAAGIAAAS